MNKLNPVVGCLRGCTYCYAMKVHKKRHKEYLKGKLQNYPQYAKPFNILQYFPERLKTIPKNPKRYKKIFMNSVSDIFYWQDRWLIDTLGMCSERQNIDFMFCTKSVEVYDKRYWSKNCQLGVTLTGKEHSDKYNYVLKHHPNNYKFASIEPLLDNIEFDLSIFDLIIVGADSSKNPIIPKKDWIQSIEHPNIHYKKNIKVFINDNNSTIIS